MTEQELLKFDTIIIGDPLSCSQVFISQIQNEDMGLDTDIDAMFSFIFSFFNDIMAGTIDPTSVASWVQYELSPVEDEDEKIIGVDKIPMLRDLITGFINTWINKLKEEGIIHNEYFAYDYAGLLRDGSFIFRRRESAG